MNATIENYGPLQKLTLPKGWCERCDEDNSGYVWEYREFGPADSNTRMGIFFRGYPVADEVASRFRQMLDETPHDCGGDELASIAEVLRDLASTNHFELHSAQTEVINGRSVLVIEGDWIERKSSATYAFVDIDNNGRFIQEVFYEVPIGQVPTASELFNQCFSNADWCTSK